MGALTHYYCVAGIVLGRPQPCLSSLSSPSSPSSSPSFTCSNPCFGLLLPLLPRGCTSSSNSSRRRWGLRNHGASSSQIGLNSTSASTRDGRSSTRYCVWLLSRPRPGPCVHRQLRNQRNPYFNRATPSDSGDSSSGLPLPSPSLSPLPAAPSSLPSSAPSSELVQQEDKVTEGGYEDASFIVDGLIHFLNESWTSFHATAEAKRLLLEAGFQLLREEDEWDVSAGGRYFFTRNMSTIVAFAIGQKYRPGNGFHVIAAHTDSPCLKLKPVSAVSKSGFLNVGVQTYGGGLWHTWFDRDLSVAGRVLLRHKTGLLSHKLVKVRRPLLRIPTLAIHLDRSVNTDGFKPNVETHLVPILTTQMMSGPSASDSPPKHHHAVLLQVIADELCCDVEEIADVELNLCDTQASCVGGVNREFIFSGRLDNLASSYCALRALLDSCQHSSDLGEESSIRMVALFDNEEVGSGSAQGAGSPTLFQAIKRVAKLLSPSKSEGVVERTIRRSFLVSADMAHALHPNYADRHEDNHQPKLHEGLVIKHNANQRYATNAATAFLFKEVARARGIPTQNFVVRNDMGCGSTIGPILASGIGIRTVDCGIPQLSMHSIREVCGTEDVKICYRHFKAFYELIAALDIQLSIDG